MLVVARFRADGTPDVSFGTGGRVVARAPVAPYSFAVNGAAFDGPGRTLLVGSSDARFAVARYVVAE